MVPSVPPMAPMAARSCLESLLFESEVSGVSWYDCESVSRVCRSEYGEGGGLSGKISKV